MQVARSARITPHMQRVTLTGDLAEYDTGGAASHLRVMLPAPHSGRWRWRTCIPCVYMTGVNMAHPLFCRPAGLRAIESDARGASAKRMRAACGPGEVS